LPVHKFE
jgi:Outer membrane protein